jgi:hypothetical protein
MRENSGIPMFGVGVTKSGGRRKGAHLAVFLISLRRLDASGCDALNRAAGANAVAIGFGHGFMMVIACVVSSM